MKITKSEIKKIIEELDEILTAEQNRVENKISYSAPQSYCDDMNGCSRGIYMAKNMAVNFLRKKLLQ